MSAVWTRAGKHEVTSREGCGSRGCAAPVQNTCLYTDQWGWRCGEALCAGHGLELGGITLCRRHAGIHLALGGDAPALPCEFDDPYRRRPSLAAWVPRDVHRDVLWLLSNVSGSEPADACIAVAQTVHATGNQEILWETEWYFDEEPRLAMSFIISGYADPVFVARVGSLVVLRESPEWLRCHLYGDPDGIDDVMQRVDFFERVRTAMQAVFVGGHEIEMALPGWSALLASRGDRG